MFCKSFKFFCSEEAGNRAHLNDILKHFCEILCLNTCANLAWDKTTGSGFVFCNKKKWSKKTQFPGQQLHLVLVLGLPFLSILHCLMKTAHCYTVHLFTRTCQWSPQFNKFISVSHWLFTISYKVTKTDTINKVTVHTYNVSRKN